MYRWLHATPPATVEDPGGDRAGARDARVRARTALIATIEQGTEVRTVADSLRDLRARNHFAELIEQSMRRVAP